MFKHRQRAGRASSSSPGSASISPSGMRRSCSSSTDATEPNTGTARQMYVNAVIQQYESDRAAAARARSASSHRSRSRFNPTRESTNLFVPGLMAMVLNIIAALMTALSLTREKETGTMEALLVSPLRPWQIIVGKVAPYLGIGFVSVLAVLAVARLVFRVPMRGQPHAAARRGHAVHPRGAVARDSRLGAHVVAARGACSPR